MGALDDLDSGPDFHRFDFWTLSLATFVELGSDCGIRFSGAWVALGRGSDCQNGGDLWSLTRGNEGFGLCRMGRAVGLGALFHFRTLLVRDGSGKFYKTS